MKKTGKLDEGVVFRNKKIVASVLASLMVLSVFMIVAIGSQPSYAASGSVSYSPSVFSSGKTALVVLNGGSFTANSVVRFYISSTDSFTSSSTSLSTSYTLQNGATTFSNTVIQLAMQSETAGTYYLAASDDNGATFTSGYPITITALAPTLAVSSTGQAGGTAIVTGSQFDPGATIDIYIGYAGGQMVASNVLASTGSFSTTITIPQSLSQTNNPTYVVAQETSSSSPNYGITAFDHFTLESSISVSPTNIAPSLSSSITITGYGFSSSATISANSITLSGGITGVTNSATATNSNGEFSLTVSFDSVSASGPITVGVTTSPSSSNTSFPAAFYVSQQNTSKVSFTFSATATMSSTYNVGDPVTATVYDFPSSQSVQVYLGSTSVGTITTSVNGYGQLLTTIPALPAATYAPTAVVASMGIYASASSIQISSDFEVSNPLNAILTTSSTEYIPSDAMFTVTAFGLRPTTTYDALDSLVASSGVYGAGLVTSIEVGTGGTSAMYPASNGTLIFTYSPAYTTTTTTSSTITMSGSVSPYHSYTFSYKTIGTPTVSSPNSFKILTQTSTQTLTVSGLIPFMSNVYPGTSYYYTAYIGSNALTLAYSSVTSSEFYAVSGAFTGSFSTPSVLGEFDLNVSYYGTSYAAGIATQNVVISVSGTSYASGNLQVVPSTSGSYYAVGYGYFTKNPNLYYMKYSGLASVGIEALTNGAFAVQFTPGSQPGGTYSVFTELSNSGTNYFVYSSYTISANMTTSTSSGNVGSAISATITGLQPNAYYNIYFANTYNTNFVTGSNGAPSATVSITIPPVVAGAYYINITPVGSSSVVLSHKFTVKANTDVTLVTDSQYAFPGQLVQFTISGMGSPAFPSGFTGLTPTYSVTVNLNGTPFETVSAFLVSSGKLSGSFLMPNSDPGSYYQITFWANETDSGSYTTETTPSTTGFATLTEPFPNSQSEFLGLVSGNGAYILGISQAQIAEIEASINSTLSVPLAQLNAAISSINGDIATITTEFGTMTTTLNTINATVNAINSGVATLGTTLGQVKTSLVSLNATVVALNNDTATISTVLGSFNTTISNINAAVSIDSGNIATIKTDLGTFTGSVTSVSNGIATIQTNLGTIQTNTNQVLPAYGLSFLIEIVILVLAAMAVAFSSIAMIRAGRGTRRI